MTAELKSHGDVSLPARERLALKAFSQTASYDGAIVDGLRAAWGGALPLLPEKLPLGLTKKQELRYGENPHQQAALYLPPLAETPWEQLSGKPLSYNNLLDADCAMRGCALLAGSCGSVVIKHATPSGMACGKTQAEAYEKAVACDPVSAFEALRDFQKLIWRRPFPFQNSLSRRWWRPNRRDAASFLRENRPSLRLLRWNGGRASPLQFTGTWSGILVQEDCLPPLPVQEDGEWVGRPRPDLWEDLMLAWKAAALSKSNAISIVRILRRWVSGGASPRLHAVEFAAAQAGERARGAVLGSDAFFPFPDGVEAAARAGVAAIIQPGGSQKDSQVFEAAERLGISMFISGSRTFRH